MFFVLSGVYAVVSRMVSCVYIIKVKGGSCWAFWAPSLASFQPFLPVLLG